MLERRALLHPYLPRRETVYLRGNPYDTYTPTTARYDDTRSS